MKSVLAILLGLSAISALSFQGAAQSECYFASTDETDAGPRPPDFKFASPLSRSVSAFKRRGGYGKSLTRMLEAAKEGTDF